MARRAARDLAPQDPLWASVVLYGDPTLRLAVTQRTHGWPATVLAVHLRGLDEFFEREPEKAAYLTEQWVAGLSAQIGKHGGEVAGLAHDMFIATFGIFATRENDAEQGVWAAWAAEEAIQSYDLFPRRH